jgi:hypothetical protein
MGQNQVLLLLNYTGAIDKNGLTSLSQQMENIITNGESMLEAHLMTKQELMLFFKCL